MITMRNIWIMMLGICLFGCGAGKQPGGGKPPPFLTAILNMETGKR